MKRHRNASFWALLTAFGLLAASPALAQETAVATSEGATAPANVETLPTGEEVIQRFISETGGEEALSKIDNRVAKGRLDFVGMGISGALTMYQTDDMQQYVEISTDAFGSIETGVSNGVAWENNPMSGARIFEGAERAAALREASLDAYAEWKEHYTSVETVGVDEVEGTSCIKVKMTPKEGNAETAWFDRETGLLIQLSAVRSSPMGDLEVTTSISDYKEIDGIWIAHSAATEFAGQKMQITLESIEHNVELEEGIFDLPEVIQNLQSSES